MLDLWLTVHWQQDWQGLREGSVILLGPVRSQWDQCAGLSVIWCTDMDKSERKLEYVTKLCGNLRNYEETWKTQQIEKLEQSSL